MNSKVKEIVHKEFVLVGQTVNFAYYSPNFGDKRTGCCITTKHRLTLPFSNKNFVQKQHDCRFPTTLRFCSPDWRYKWKTAILTQLRWSRQNRWTPSQNTNSTIYFKKAETLGTVHTGERGLLQMWWWPVGPKLIFIRCQQRSWKLWMAPCIVVDKPSSCIV
jgi:hypothetical protein